MRLFELRNFLADCGDMTLAEVPCGVCQFLTDAELLERVELWPITEVCPSCADEIRADDEEPAGRDCDCAGGCPACLGVRGML
jgi:hypothetical protein